MPQPPPPPSPALPLSFRATAHCLLPEGIEVLLVERKDRGPRQSPRRRDRGAEVRQVFVRHRRAERRGRVCGDSSRSAQLVHAPTTDTHYLDVLKDVSHRKRTACVS